MSASDTPGILSTGQTGMLHGMFFLSGAAGLIFELIWFRLAALSFGSSIWAATAVLAAFMGGLAAGNGIAMLIGERITRPLRLYARLEVVVACTGFLLIFMLPTVGLWTTALALDFLAAGGGWPLQVMRLSIAFLLMLIPGTAMGLTLPLLVRSLQSRGYSGHIIGRLYGWNTAGAISGLLMCEYLFLKYLGITGSALLAAATCLAAAGIASGIRQPSEHARADKFKLQWRYGLAAALTGTIILGLEVIWFRLLLLHLRGTDSSFALLLALVLSGIAGGSLLCSKWLKHHRASPHMVVALALSSAIIVPLGYLSLTLPINIWIRATLMILPGALLSGAILPMLAAVISEQNRRPMTSTGWIWLANTAGGALGAAIAGLYLLPAYGMEFSLFALALGYVAVAVCLAPGRITWVACLLITSANLVFPRGWTEQHLQSASKTYRQLDQSRVIKVREGLNETVQLLETRKYGQPYSFRLLTDGYSMSGTERDSQRYMKLFAWLPQSLHPQPESALLISYGVGTTASALLADERLKALSIVDLSPDVLAMSPAIHARGADPLEDVRSTVIVEDGRQFLLVTDQAFDIITAEPPPPRMKGVVNLYTQEYFQLIRQHLSPGGYASYWLPVDQMTIASSHAVIAAFCNVFSDCNLWSGSNYNWILLGSNAAESLHGNQIPELWSSPQAPALAALGLEKPGMLGAAFLADAQQLKAWIADQAPLLDHWPKRLDEQQASRHDIQLYARWADNLEARKRFASSQWVQQFFPASFRASALNYFDLQPILNNEIPPDSTGNLPLVHRLLTSTDLDTPVYWLLGSDLAEQQLIDQLLENGYQSEFAFPLGIRAMVEQNFTAAASLFVEALQSGDGRAHGPAVYSLCRNGQLQTARSLAAQHPDFTAFKCWPGD